MPLRNGSIIKGKLNGETIYKGEAHCDFCGAHEPVNAERDFITGTKPWKYVDFKYRAWVACSPKCAAELSAIAYEDLKQDAALMANKVYPVVPVWKGHITRTAPIEGTMEVPWYREFLATADERYKALVASYAAARARRFERKAVA